MLRPPLVGATTQLSMDIFMAHDNGDDDSPPYLPTYLQVVEILKKAGADETLKDKEGHTAADYGYKPTPKEAIAAAGEGGAAGETAAAAKGKEEL